MRFAGVDLAGVARNPTGYCLLNVEGEYKRVTTKVLHTDDELIAQLEEDKPELTAFDAPLIFENKNRACERILQEYGALPVTLPGMSMLAERGASLAGRLSDRFRLIEVYAKASAKILGVYHKDDFRYQKNTMSLDLDGDVNTRLLVRDELDAILAAITAYLHTQNQTKTVGGDDGQVVVPKV